MKKVRQEVVAKTNGQQQPWSSFSLSDDFYFSDRPSDPSIANATPAKADPATKIDSQPMADQSIAVKLQELNTKKAEFQTILPKKQNQKKVFTGMGWASLAVFAAGTGIGTYAYVSANALKPQYDAATTAADASAFRTQIEQMNSLFKVGTIIGLGGAAGGISSLLLSPNTKSIEDSIKSLDEQIQALQGEI
jgi:hypothetical protein